MAGDGDKVRPQGLGGEGDLHKALHRVGVEEGLGVFGLEARGDLSDREDGADLVIDHHDAHNGGIRPDGGENILDGDDAAGVLGADVGHLIALLGHPLAAFQYGVVLDGGGDDVAAQVAVLVRDGLDGPVVALGAAGGEIELLCFAPQGGGHGPAPLLHAALHGKACLILGAGVSKLLR